MKYCPNCGNELKKKDVYCPSCGKKIEKEEDVKNDTVDLSNKINKRDIATQIILSIITCGIYSLYWIATITDDVNTLNDDKLSMSGGTVILLSIVTCGLYLIYWNYDMGKKLYDISKRTNIGINDNSIMYMIFSLLKLDIISYILIQCDLNKFGN